MWRRTNGDLRQSDADASPLGPWWGRPEHLDSKLRTDIIEMLEAVHFPTEPRWSAAAAGDAASAINLAIRAILIEDEPLIPYRDVILIALWRCAADGDLTAGLVMDWLGLRRA